MPFAQELAHRFSAGRKAVRPLWPMVLIVSAFAAGSPAQSEDGFLNWIVKSVTSDEEGALIEASLGTPQAGDTLMQGQRISTGPDQQMVLTNGRDLVTLNPGTSVEIGDNDSTTDEANLELKSGTVHVKAGKRTPGHTFSVETAYLVATVKGTQFDVSTSAEISAVSVTEGVVGVQATATRQGVDVTPGKTAIVDRLTTSLPELINSPAGGAAAVIGDENTETASAEDGTDISGTGDIGSADSADGSGDGSSGSGSGSSSSGSSGSSTSGSTGSVGGAVGAAGEAAGGAVSGATGAVGGAVSDASGAVGGAVSDATGAIGGAVGGAVGSAVSGVGGAVGGAVSGVGGAVGGAVSGVGGAVGGAVGGLGGALGGALGGGRSK
jgi:hypothetical protein